MKGYDQKPPSHRAFLDYHRFIFKNSHSEIISDPIRFTKHSISSKIKPHKTINIISSSVSQESSGINFSLAYSEIANKSCEVSSFKESYFDFKDQKPNKSMEERRDYQRMNQSASRIDPSIHMRKNAKIQKAYEGEYILKNLDDDQFESKYRAEIHHQKGQKQKQKQQQQQQQKKKISQGIELQLNQSKNSMVTQSQKELKSVKETSSNNTSELNIKSELFLSNASEKKTQQLIADQRQPSSTIQEKTFGQLNEHYQSHFDSKQESLISSEKVINMKNRQSQNQNLEKMKNLKVNGAGNSKAKKQSSDDDSNQSFENVRESSEQNEKMSTRNAKDNSSSSDEQEDFYSRIQTTINKTMNKSIHEQQNQNLDKPNSSLVEKTSNNQEPSDEDSFHTIKNNQTILSNGSLKKEDSAKTPQATKIQQFQNRTTSNLDQKVETIIKKDQNTEIVNQDQQQFLKQNQEENTLSPFQANKQEKFATKSTQRLPQTKKQESSSSQASFEVDNQDQLNETYEKNISNNFGKNASKIKISSDNIAEKTHKTEDKNKSKDDQMSEEKQKSNTNQPQTKSNNQISNSQQVELRSDKRKKKLQSQRNCRKRNSSEESWTSSSGEDQEYEVMYKTNAEENMNLLKQMLKGQQLIDDGGFSLKKQLGDFLLVHQENLKIQAQPDKDNIDQSHSLQTNKKFTNKQGQDEGQQNTKNLLKQSQTEKKLNEELFDGKNQKLDGERIFQKSQMKQVTEGFTQEQNKQTRKIQPGDTKQLSKQTQQIAQKSFRQTVHLNKEDQEWFMESLSENLAKSLRKQFSEELKSQKELFYYQLKDNLLQQITEKFVNLKNELSVENNQRQIFVQRQVHVSVNPSINEQSNLHKQNQAIQGQKDPIIEQESNKPLSQQLKQVIQQQITTQIVPLVKQVKSILYQQIQSIFKASLSTILKDQLIKAVKQELTPVIKSEITESIRNQISQSLRSQISLALKDDLKLILKDQFTQNWKKEYEFMRSEMILPPKLEEIPKQHAVTDRKQQVSEIESKITMEHNPTEKNQESQNQKNSMQQVNQNQEYIGIKNEEQNERLDEKQFQERKPSSSASNESIDDCSHPELPQPGQNTKDMSSQPENQENTEKNTTYDQHSQNERNENTSNKNTNGHKEDSVQESDSDKSFEVEENPLQK